METRVFFSLSGDIYALCSVREQRPSGALTRSLVRRSPDRSSTGCVSHTLICAHRDERTYDTHILLKTNVAQRRQHLDSTWCVFFVNVPVNKYFQFTRGVSAFQVHAHTRTLPKMWVHVCACKLTPWTLKCKCIHHVPERRAPADIVFGLC